MSWGDGMADSMAQAKADKMQERAQERAKYSESCRELATDSQKLTEYLKGKTGGDKELFDKCRSLDLITSKQINDAYSEQSQAELAKFINEQRPDLIDAAKSYSDKVKEINENILLDICRALASAAATSTANPESTAAIATRIFSDFGYIPSPGKAYDQALPLGGKGIPLLGILYAPSAPEWNEFIKVPYGGSNSYWDNMFEGGAGILDGKSTALTNRGPAIDRAMGKKGPSWNFYYPEKVDGPAFGLPRDFVATGTHAAAWPQGWAQTLATIMGQLRYLAVVADYRAADGMDGGSWHEDAISDLRGGDIGKGMNEIFKRNHGNYHGLLGDEGGTRLNAAEVSQMGTEWCDKITSWRPFNAYYNKTNNYKQTAIAGRSAITTTPGSAMISVNGILESGGPYMMTPMIGNMDQQTAATSIVEGADNGGIITDLHFGWTSTPHDGGWGYDKANEGTWSLGANARRLKEMGRKFGRIGGEYGKIGRVLVGIGSTVERFAQKTKKHSDKIVEIHLLIIQKQCELQKELPDLLEDRTGFWEGFWDDLDKHKMDIDDARRALTATAVNPEDVIYGSDRQALLFREQCFLLSFVADLAGFKKHILDKVDYEGSLESQTPMAPLPHEMTKLAAAAAISEQRGSSMTGGRGSVFKRLPYVAREFNSSQTERNATLLVDGDPYAFINALTQNPSAAALHEATPAEISLLQPHIRLYKVEFEDGANGDRKEVETEIKFNSHLTQGPGGEMDAFLHSNIRGVGAGLKSFNFTYDGSNPFAVKKSIKANLKIFANSFSELYRDRGGYSYLDLALKTWNTAEQKKLDECSPKLMDIINENINKSELNFRLKVEVGLSVPPNEMSVISKDLRDALAESYVTLQLTPTVHNFDFDDMGRVTFNLNYLAYIEEFFDTKMFNVFANKDITLKRYEREFKMKTFRKECNQKQVDQQKQDYALVAKQEISRSVSTLLTSMMAKDLIYYIDLPYSVVKTFMLNGPYGSYDAIRSQIKPKLQKEANTILKENIKNAMEGAFDVDDASTDTTTDQQRRAQIAAALVGSDPERTSLGYFYLSEMVDLILVNIEEELSDLSSGDDLDKMVGAEVSCEDVSLRKQELNNAIAAFKKIRILLGPMELQHPEGAEGKNSVHVNLGDVPISVKYFTEWLASKMLKKDEVFYPLTRFMNDLLNDLVSNFLNNEMCFGYSIKQKTRVQQATITSWGESEKLDPITKTLVDLGPNGRHTVKKYLSEYDPTTQQVTFQEQSKALGLSPETSWADLVAMRAHLEELPRPALNPSGPGGSQRTSVPIQNAYNYFVFFAGRTMPFEKMRGIKGQDQRRGIFHYCLGRPTGILNNIKLSKTQTKGLAEVRFEQDGYDGLSQLRVIYDAQINTMANVNTFPGTYVYIDPVGFAPELDPAAPGGYNLTKLGVGGYYMIVRSEHEFGPGKANTILHTKWVNQVDTIADQNTDDTVDTTYGDGNPTNRQCASIELREDPNAENIDINSFSGFAPGS